MNEYKKCQSTLYTLVCTYVTMYFTYYTINFDGKPFQNLIVLNSKAKTNYLKLTTKLQYVFLYIKVTY